MELNANKPRSSSGSCTLIADSEEMMMMKGYVNTTGEIKRLRSCGGWDPDSSVREGDKPFAGMTAASVLGSRGSRPDWEVR